MQVKKVRNKSDTNHYLSDDSGIAVDYRSTPSQAKLVNLFCYDGFRSQNLHKGEVHSANKLPCFKRGLST
jgi:hypothetical protein